MLKLILLILILSLKCFCQETNEQKYNLAYTKLGESIYIASGTQDNLNKFFKSYEDKINKEYRPILGWTTGIIDSIIKNRIDINIGFP